MIFHAFDKSLLFKTKLIIYMNKWMIFGKKIIVPTIAAKTDETNTDAALISLIVFARS